MTVRIGSNIASLISQRQLANSSTALSRTLERLSSGSRINRASDDAAGLSVAQSLNAKSRVYAQGVRNLNDGVSALSIADQALENLSRIVERQRELALQAANGVFSSGQRESLNTEAQALSTEYQRIIDSTTFNGQSLLNRSIAGLSLQGGFGSQGVLNAEILGVADEETTVIVQDILSQTFSNFGSLGAIKDIQYFVHDFNGDGIDDLLFVAREATGTPTIDYAMGIMLGSASGTYSLSTAIREGTLDPPTAANIQNFEVQVDTASGTISVGAQNNFGANYALDVWDYDASGKIEATPTSTTGAFLVLSGNTTGTPVGDFNNDGQNDQVSFTLPYSLQVTTIVTEEQTILAGQIRSLQQSAFSLLTSEDALSANSALTVLAQDLTDARARVGAAQSRIQAASSVLRSTEENFRTAESRIRDADIANESANLIRLTILQQSSAAVLAQANTQPELALSLLEQI